MKKVRFEVPGEPTGKGRPRFSKFGGPRSPEKTVLYENLVKTCYSSQCNDFMFEQGKQLDVRIIAYYAIPQSVSKKKRKRMIDKIERPLKKPDADNVVKVILDALNKIAYYGRGGYVYQILQLLSGNAFFLLDYGKYFFMS